MFCRTKSIVFKIKMLICLLLCCSFENLNKYMANILRTIGDDKLMVSFDVTTLYTNIFIVNRLNIVKDCVNNYNQFTRKMPIHHNLVNLVLTTTWCTFNYQFHQQTDSVAMGEPASSTTAKIYLQALEQTAISMALHPPKVWEQVVGDVYSILKCTHLETSSITSTIFIKTFTT